MIKTYCTVNDFEHAEVIRRSRFLTVTAYVETEKAAAEILETLKKKYYDATHICYAYRLGANSDTVKFSDAGEPKGTAGVPILNALVENDCTYSLAAVVRWFGGVKLGAGGLTRAYHDCAGETIALGGKKRYSLKALWRVTCPISMYGALERIALSAGAKVSDREFAENASFTVAADIDGKHLIPALNDAAGGRAQAVFLEETYIAE